MVRTYSALLIGELGPDARDVELGAGAQRVELQLERRGVGDRVRGLLSPAAPSRAPSRAASAARTADLSFFGCLPGDLGFILKPDEAAALLEGKPPSWRNVIRPYPIGNDLTKDPEQRASRWVIDFGHRTLEQAMQFSPRPSRTSGSASSRRATRSVDPHTGATGGASRSR